MNEGNDDIRQVLQLAAGWLAKAVADGIHKNTAVPGSLPRTLERVQELLRAMDEDRDS